jgi:threonine/homoserine/homoserine lactone efflux protein
MPAATSGPVARRNPAPGHTVYDRDMPSLETLTVVALASIVLVVVPGPAVMYILTRSVAQGRAAGLMSAVGVNAGSAIHVLAAVAGLSVILASSAVAFSVVKWAGVAYLAWIGISTLLAGDRSFSVPETEPDSLRRIFLQGVLVNVLNPKVAMFFLAFLPQFVDPLDANAALQSLVLGLTLVGIGLISDSLYAIAGGAIGRWFRADARRARTTRIASGVVYLTLAGLAARTAR